METKDRERQTERENQKMIFSLISAGLMIKSFWKFIINAALLSDEKRKRKHKKVERKRKVFRLIESTFSLLHGTFSSLPRLREQHNHRLERRALSETYPSRRHLRWSYSSRLILSPWPASHRSSSLSCFCLYVLREVREEEGWLW